MSSSTPNRRYWMGESRTRQSNHVQPFIKSRGKKGICWSHGIALLYIFWYAPDHNEIPSTNEVRAQDTKDELRSADVTTALVPAGAGLSQGHKGLQAQLHYLLCLAPLLAMPLSPDICHHNAASVISIHSSEMTRWNPRCFTWNQEVPHYPRSWREYPRYSGHRD